MSSRYHGILRKQGVKGNETGIAFAGSICYTIIGISCGFFKDNSIAPSGKGLLPMAEIPPEKWIERAAYDLDTARTLQQDGRYLYVLLFCQQALEKWLKALILRRSGGYPPRVHQLARLADTAGVSLSDEQGDFLRELSFYYVQTRYPDDIPDPASISKEFACEMLVKTEEILSWLETLY